jgi:hypothetical protein
MPRNPEDDLQARRSLDEWLTERPDAAIVVAAIDQRQDEGLDVGLRFSALTAYHLLGLMQVLIDHTMTIFEETGASQSPEYDTLRQVKALLGGPALNNCARQAVPPRLSFS